MPTMLSIKEAVIRLKSEYPRQGVTEHALRQCYKNGQIKGLSLGKRGKVLVSWESVCGFLEGSFYEGM